MLAEIGKIYSRAFRMIFRHPQFLLLSAVSLLFSQAVSHINLQVKVLGSLGVIVLVGWVRVFVDFVLMTGFPLAFILMVYHGDLGINPKEIFQEVRKYFWKFVRQFFAGMLFSLIYSLPVLCLGAFSVFIDDADFFIIIGLLWLFVFGFLSFGSITLGQRILLDGGEGTFKNSLRGLYILNGNSVFFLILYFMYIFIAAFQFFSSFLIGSTITGVDLLSVPITSFTLFVKNAYTATQTPLVIGWSTIWGIVLFPFYTIVSTLAYLRFKKL